jgi:hypothetical protein
MARAAKPDGLGEVAGFESWRLVVVEAQPKAARVVLNDQRRRRNDRRVVFLSAAMPLM